MAENPPSIVVIAGPNGAGKSTTAPVLLKETFATPEFVNADIIAQGLSGFAPENSALEAGRIMLRRLKQLARERQTFAFETTLASRSFAPWLREQKSSGYILTLVFLWLSSPELAQQRVRERVRLGGHHVLDDVVKRRYEVGLKNFFSLYKPVADTWTFYDNSDSSGSRLIAEQSIDGKQVIHDGGLWQTLQKSYR